MANREQIRQQAAGRVRRLFARGRIEAFVQALLDGRDSPMQEVPVRYCDGDEDAVHRPRIAAASTRTRSLVVW